MADQLPELPWATLASHFTYTPRNPTAKTPTNLVPLSNPTQDSDVRAFVTACADAITHHATHELAKYPATYPVPHDSEILISSAVVRRISPLFRQVHDALAPFESTNRWAAGVVDDPECRHLEAEECACLVPYADRTAAAVMIEKQENDCRNFWEVNDVGLRRWELVRVLLVKGELEPILRLREHEWFSYCDWWDLRLCDCGSGDDDSSSNKLYERALLSFLCLSIFRHRPETWPSNSADGKDYRLTKMYQHTLREATKTGETAPLPSIMHRPLYGISEDQFSAYPRARDVARWAHLGEYYWDLDRNYPEGQLSYDEFLSFEKENVYVPHEDDIPPVRQTLTTAGNLPTELVDQIMKIAEYVPRRRLKVAHDPLHPDNKTELDAYLAECWAVVVRCEVFARAMLDEDLEWHARVKYQLWLLLN
ncbi:hypothetical protein CPLU01_13746 [Colletotrichum plurivorum]|uniref:Uncharacterized protein n=1 Tax=Colletotrichum plurivorum TaxID=2175906 RepID=A0A8H6JQ00_9PEZI|nr:hypothetical protein CPLU01_13746 [Colletotrichum plurivorum]